MVGGVPVVGEVFLFLSPCTGKLGLLVCLQIHAYLHTRSYVCFAVCARLDLCDSVSAFLSVCWCEFFPGDVRPSV